MELALTTPYEQCLPHWTKQRSNLSKPDSGWEFADPLRFPLAPSPVQPYADRRSFAKRLERQQAGQGAARGPAGGVGGAAGVQAGGAVAGATGGVAGAQAGAAGNGAGAQAGGLAAGAVGAMGGADAARAEVQLTSATAEDGVP